MAVLYVAEFAAVGGTGNFPVAGALCPPIAEQTVAVGGASTPTTNGFNAKTYFIRVNTDVVCSIAIGLTPIATATSMRLAANQTEYFSVQPGHKIAVITNS